MPTTRTGKRLMRDFRAPKACEFDLPWRWLDEADIEAIEREAAAAERERLRLQADEYVRRSAPPRDSSWTLHAAWEWVRDVFLAEPEDTP